MNVICLHEPALYALIETVVERLKRDIGKGSILALQELLEMLNTWLVGHLLIELAVRLQGLQKIFRLGVEGCADIRFDHVSHRPGAGVCLFRLDFQRGIIRLRQFLQKRIIKPRRIGMRLFNALLFRVPVIGMDGVLKIDIRYPAVFL
jgi:hypothetical protein